MSGFDYNTIIGRDPKLFTWHIDNVLRNAGLPRDKWTFNTVIYRNKKIKPEITDELVSICTANDINYVFYDEPHDNFLVNLYACWNMVQMLGNRPATLRAGSDQAFSDGFFANLYEAWKSFTDEVVLQTHTVESPLSPQSRHFIGDFGSTPDTFKEKEFNEFAASISRPGTYTIDEALKIWGKPTSFSSSIKTPHNRNDSCSWLQSKELFRKFGPMPPISGGWTGDVIIHDRYELAGIPNRLVGDCVTYHLVRGESR